MNKEMTKATSPAQAKISRRQLLPHESQGVRELHKIILGLLVILCARRALRMNGKQRYQVCQDARSVVMLDVNILLHRTASVAGFYSDMGHKSEDKLSKFRTNRNKLLQRI